MAYELLAGRRPFAGATWAALLRAIEAGPVAAIAGCPRWLEAIVRRCLAVAPARRFASMREVADAIARGAARRPPARWVAGAIAAAAIASVATWLASTGGQPPAAAKACAVDVADLAAVPAETSARLGAAASAAVVRWEREFADERVALCNATDAAPKLAARARCLDERRGELAELLARGHRDDVLDALAALPPPSACRLADPGDADPLPLDPQRAEAAREVAAALPALRARIALGDARGSLDAAATLVARAQASAHAPTLGDALVTLADAKRGAGQLVEAAADARDAAAAAERGRADAIAARAWVARVAIAGDRRALEEAADLDALAVSAVARAGAPAQLVAMLARSRGLAAFARGDLASARTQLADARTAFAALDGERSVDVSAADIALGAVAREAGDLDEAEARDRAALAMDRALRAPGHPDIARDLHDLAGVLRLRGDLANAEATYRQALAIEDAARRSPPGSRTTRSGS